MILEKKFYEEYLLKYCLNLCCLFYIFECKFVYVMYLVLMYILFKVIYYF